MLQKHRRLWKAIAMVLVIALHWLLVAMNFVHGIEGKPLTLSLSAFYIVSLCTTAFVFGESKFFLVYGSLYWGLTLLSYIIVILPDPGWFAGIMYLVFYHTATPFFGIFSLLNHCGPQPLPNVLFFILTYILFLLTHLLGKKYERKKSVKA